MAYEVMQVTPHISLQFKCAFIPSCRIFAAWNFYAECLLEMNCMRIELEHADEMYAF